MFKKYAFLIIAGFIALNVLHVLAYNAAQFAGLKIQKTPYEILTLYQYDKAKQSNADLIFVGDISLGNSIKAQLFSKEASLKAENYALSATSGFRSSYEIMKTAYEHNPKLKTVVLMQTVDIFTRDKVSEYKFPIRYFAFGNFEGVDLDILNLATFNLFTKAIRKRIQNKNNPSAEIANDYIAQSPRLGSDAIFGPLKPSQIKPDTLEYLYKISQYCQDKKLNCVYAHGPRVEDFCENSKPYLEAINKLIKLTKLSLAEGSPLCIPRSKLGDAGDHVLPTYKAEFTRRYYRLLKPYIKSR